MLWDAITDGYEVIKDAKEIAAAFADAPAPVILAVRDIATAAIHGDKLALQVGVEELRTAVAVIEEDLVEARAAIDKLIAGVEKLIGDF